MHSNASSTFYVTFVHLDKLIVAQVVKKFPTFYGSKALLLCLQEPATGPYLEPDGPSPHTSYPISLRSILTLYSSLKLGLPNGLFPSGLNTKIMYAF
jgi:hypothetical protein